MCRGVKYFVVHSKVAVDDSIAKRYDFPVFADLILQLRVKTTGLRQCLYDDCKFTFGRWAQQFTLPTLRERHVMKKSKNVFAGGQHVP